VRRRQWVIGDVGEKREDIAGFCLCMKPPEVEAAESFGKIRCSNGRELGNIAQLFLRAANRWLGPPGTWTFGGRCAAMRKCRV
jgi:hypothetical protein